MPSKISLTGTVRGLSQVLLSVTNAKMQEQNKYGKQEKKRKKKQKKKTNKKEK